MLIDPVSRRKFLGWGAVAGLALTGITIAKRRAGTEYGKGVYGFSSYGFAVLRKHASVFTGWAGAGGRPSLRQ